MLSDVLFRLRALVRRDAVERDLDDELRFHLDNQIDKHVAGGVSRHEAERLARAALGGVDAVKAACRDERRVPWVDDVLRDLRYGCRGLRRTPVFAVAAGAILSVGIGATTAVYSYANAFFLRSLTATAPESLVRVYARPDGQPRPDGLGLVSYPVFLDLEHGVTALRSVAAHQYETIEIGAAGQTPRRGHVEVVSGNYFDMLGVTASIGRVLTQNDDRPIGGQPVAVVSHRVWRQQLGGEPDAIGMSVELNGRAFRVVGVAPQDFTGSYGAFVADAWVPLFMRGRIRPGGLDITHEGWAWLFTTGRLAADFTIDDLEAELQQLSASGGPRLTAVRAGALPEIVSGATKGVLWLLAVLAGLVLVAVCANLGALILVRLVAGRRELDTLRALGAGRRQVVGHVLGETLVLAIVGGAGGFLLSIWLVDLGTSVRPPDWSAFAPDPELDVGVIGFVALASVVSALIVGAVPAVRGTGDLGRTGSGPQSGSASVLSARTSALVGLQVAACAVILVVAGLLTRSGLEASRFDPGFRHEDVLAFNLDLDRHRYPPEEGMSFYSRLLADAGAGGLPVEAVALTSVVPLGGSGESRRYWMDREIDKAAVTAGISIPESRVSVGYFEALDIPLLAGRVRTAEQN